MDGFDWNSAAELFPSRSRRTGRQLTYRRFDRVSEAVRFAVEDLPAALLTGAYLEVDEERFDAHGIRRLYARRDFPAERRIVGTAA
ncbi:hypothetical protein [Rhodoplanes roseus]|uniref:Uncharacterized protein n=1 Tax=Rhodoplanes roseus TaxID=29409 RepID=A0A327L4F4_9BRAD|nr:hypothetical protein [Rhodoplanes roseus]RAI45286.1 hypothetical protein CH341_04635 [Rhodoplanes roseus]